jgi:hypothetical protein
MKFYKVKELGPKLVFSPISENLSFILSFLFPERLHCFYTYYYIYFLCYYQSTIYYNYSRNLYIKCRVSAFETELY